MILKYKRHFCRFLLSRLMKLSGIIKYLDLESALDLFRHFEVFYRKNGRIRGGNPIFNVILCVWPHHNVITAVIHSRVIHSYN